MSPIDRVPLTSYECSIATMGLSRTISEIDRDFSWKLQNFPISCILCPRWRGSPWNWVLPLGVKKLEKWGYRADEEFDDNFSHVDRMHQCDWQTDRQTNRWKDTGREQRLRLCIASCSKNTRAVTMWILPVPFAVNNLMLLVLFWHQKPLSCIAFKHKIFHDKAHNFCQFLHSN